MTGSLQIKNDKYYAVINTTVDGKRKQKWINTGFLIKNNKKKAEQFLREKLKEYELKEGLIQTDILFSEYIKHWLNVSKIKIDEVTHQGYEATANAHVIPYFETKKIKLSDISISNLQQYINDKYEHGRIDGKGGLSPKTLRLHKIILQQTLKEAVRNNILQSNPCDNLILPQLQRYEYDFYTAKELNELFEAIKDEPLYPFIKITAIYGLRRSEALGLKWDSVNLEANTITIKHTVSKGTRTVEKDKTKNATSYRSFPLTEEIRRFILEAKNNENKNRMLFGNEYQENDYIFKWDSGAKYTPEFITHKFSKILKTYGFRHIRFHELRHSCASLLIANGFTLKDVQEWLGHSDIKMTANIYSHLDTSRKNNIADSLENSLSV